MLPEEQTPEEPINFEDKVIEKKHSTHQREISEGWYRWLKIRMPEIYKLWIIIALMECYQDGYNKAKQELLAENNKLKEENEKLKVASEGFLLHNCSLYKDIELQRNAIKELQAVINSKELKQQFNT